VGKTGPFAGSGYLIPVGQQDKFGKNTGVITGQIHGKIPVFQV
jgi:hypothetical protein